MVVGNEEIKTSLLLAAINPNMGGYAWVLSYTSNLWVMSRVGHASVLSSMDCKGFCPEGRVDAVSSWD